MSDDGRHRQRRPAPRSEVSNGVFATTPAHDLGAIAIKPRWSARCRARPCIRGNHGSDF